MVLVAQIIVDVPLMQTDRPYSYLIPEAMQGQIANSRLDSGSG